MSKIGIPDDDIKKSEIFLSIIAIKVRYHFCMSNNTRLYKKLIVAYLVLYFSLRVNLWQINLFFYSILADVDRVRLDLICSSTSGKSNEHLLMAEQRRFQYFVAISKLLYRLERCLSNCIEPFNVEFFGESLQISLSHVELYTSVYVKLSLALFH
jgi:hypothetical protein